MIFIEKLTCHKTSYLFKKPCQFNKRITQKLFTEIWKMEAANCQT